MTSIVRYNNKYYVVNNLEKFLIKLLNGKNIFGKLNPKTFLNPKKFIDIDFNLNVTVYRDSVPLYSLCLYDFCNFIVSFKI